MRNIFNIVAIVLFVAAMVTSAICWFTSGTVQAFFAVWTVMLLITGWVFQIISWFVG